MEYPSRIEMKTNPILHYSELSQDQKEQVAKHYSTTSQSRSIEDYVYEVNEAGMIIDRKTIAQHERDTAPLVKRKPTGVNIDG